MVPEKSIFLDKYIGFEKRTNSKRCYGKILLSWDWSELFFIEFLLWIIIILEPRRKELNPNSMQPSRYIFILHYILVLIFHILYSRKVKKWIEISPFGSSTFLDECEYHDGEKHMFDHWSICLLSVFSQIPVCRRSRKRNALQISNYRMVWSSGVGGTEHTKFLL